MRRWRRPAQEPERASLTDRHDDADPGEIVQHLRDGVIMVDAAWVVRWLNDAARLLLGAPDNAAGRPLLEVVRDHRVDALARQAVDAQTEQVADVTLPVSDRSLRVRAIPLTGTRACCLILEETTRVRYLETVRQAFVANLSHELRTPLAGLDLAAQTLAGQLPGEGATATFMDRILEESQRLAAILQNLTQLAALDAEQIQVERRPFAVAALLDENAARAAARASGAGLTLRVEPVDPSLEAFADRAKTDQALQSLVDNALKFTPAGEVVMSAAAAGEVVEIAIRDTGIGIPPQDLPRIFERFYKVDRARGGQAGTGLGLSIARHLVELQGGTLTAQSQPGTGTTVRLRLPRPSIIEP